MNAGGEPDEGTERWPQTFVGGGSTAWRRAGSAAPAGTT